MNMYKRNELRTFLYTGALLGLSTIPVAANMKSNVDQLILEHGNQLGSLSEYIISDERIKFGGRDKVINNNALKHAREVATIINDKNGGGAKLMEDCCWRPQPATYSNFITSPVEKLFIANDPTKIINLVNPSDPGRRLMKIPSNLGSSMLSVFNQMRKVSDGYNGLNQGQQGLDNMDLFTYRWMKALTAGIPKTLDLETDAMPVDSIISKLTWNWSYELEKYRQYREGGLTSNAGTLHTLPYPDAFRDTFRDNYNWACIVCAGAGFYDTTGMYTLNSEGNYIANSFYTQVVNKLSATQKVWLAKQYDEGFKHADGSSAPPLQVSLGLTMQSQSVNNPSTPDTEATYGTHCHSAQEVYIPIDPMGYDKKMNRNVLKNEEGSAYNTNSYMAGLHGSDNLVPSLSSFRNMQDQIKLQGSKKTYTELKNGDVVYWDKYNKHSMHPGKRFQFAAWARIDRPYEGTFFPNDIDALTAAGGMNTIDGESGEAYGRRCTP
tara:strand:+ start:64 stop:1542 length:1479 start_codon:yes stop_codon:yes gene_type:complete